MSSALRTEESAVARVVASNDEIACFALGGGCSGVLAAIDGRATLREVFARAGVARSEGFAYVSALRELGLIALKDAKDAKEER